MDLFIIIKLKEDFYVYKRKNSSINRINISFSYNMNYINLLFKGVMVAKINVSCPYCCSSKKVVCNGYTPTRIQRYLCSSCNKTFQLSFSQKASEPGVHQQIINMAKNGVSCRAIARTMGISLNTVLKYSKNVENRSSKNK
ncbi:TPA: IS1 family transposase [Proteus mirabilis]|nr:IS1 family transposase [Proteus mirabilis]